MHWRTKPLRHRIRMLGHCIEKLLFPLNAGFIRITNNKSPLPMKLQVGDIVSFLDDVGEGEVVAIIDEYRVSVLVDGFERPFTSKELILMDPNQGEAFAKQVANELFSPSSKEDAPTVRKKEGPKPKARPSNEINLHMQDLREEYADMSAGEKLNMQLRYFSEKLEEAIRMKRKNLIVIHGVGKGTLRAAVRDLLDDYPHITYCDASYDTYGYGATEVIIE